ncbi:MAG: glycosyl hydrolase, partial [bacterium]|nr:glycosyl hydrolase [bacterium]
MNKNTLILTALALSLTFSFGITSHANAANPFSNNRQGLINYLNGLSNNQNSRLISGQMLGSARTEMLWQKWQIGDGPLMRMAENIHTQTGQWIGLAGFEYTGYDGLVQPEWVNPVAINYWNQGGLVQIMAHLFNPATGGEWDTNINLSDVYTPGTTAYNNFKIVLDKIAAGFQELENNGVIVIWRPFHEMNYAWFWWGHKNPDVYKRLWQYTHNYFTVTKGLSNLVWSYTPNTQTISNASDLTTAVTRYYPGDQYVDIVGLDFYGIENPERAVGYSELAVLGKPFVLGEVGPANVGICEQSCYDYAKLVPAIKQYFPKTVTFMAWSAGARMDKNPNVKTLLDDPWVLNRGELGGGITPPIPGASTCSNLLNSTLTVPANFGASFNWFSSAKELLLQASCGSGGSFVTVGSGSNTQYIYKTG